MVKQVVTFLFFSFFSTFHFLGIASVQAQSSYPEGIIEEVVYGTFESPAGILHTDSDIAVVWELSGKVWVINGNEVPTEPAIDISEEVAFWGDHGMIGAALHPEFLSNGYIYLFYSVDRHHLKNFGTPNYNPESSETYGPSMGRLTRYSLNTIDFQFAIPGSRFVLLGEQINTGIPICTPSHGVGTVLFGEDGSLLLSTGDGNTWVATEDGNGFNGEGPLPSFAYDQYALDDGILRPDEFIGAYRSQYLDGLNGKILRIDPETGEGIANNPFFQEDDPNSARSKIWSLGLRNPYRMTIKPNTGFGEMEDGFPGVLYVHDVGDWIFEEINVVHQAGLNFGWPMYQGPSLHAFYNSALTQNTNAPNPFGGTSSCPEFFYYQDLVLQPNESHNVAFPNPCNENELVPDDIVVFEHERPVLAYANSANIEYLHAVIPTFDENGEADFQTIEESSDGIPGESFHGISGSGGFFINHESMPPELQGTFVQGDFTGWLRAFEFDETNELEAVDVWNANIGAPIHVTQNPSDGCLYVTSIYPPEIKRICFGGNLKPVINVNPEIVFGIGVLDVVFDASESYDPEGGPLSYSWVFSDGEEDSGEVISRVFSPSGSGMETLELILTVEDEEGAQSSQVIPISLNNTPPEAEITSFNDGDLYSVISPTLLQLQASVTDAESNSSQMEYQWNLLLRHNTHFHHLDEISGNNSSVLIYPTGCSEDETYWYEMVLTVTDPGGLSATDSVQIYPDCEGTLVPSGDPVITLYPNPVASGSFQVKSNSGFGQEIEYNILSSDGRIVLSKKRIIYSGRAYFNVDVESLSAGVYIFDLKTNGKHHKTRFVVN